MNLLIRGSRGRHVTIIGTDSVVNLEVKRIFDPESKLVVGFRVLDVAVDHLGGGEGFDGAGRITVELTTQTWRAVSTNGKFDRHISQEAGLNAVVVLRSAIAAKIVRSEEETLVGVGGVFSFVLM